jgi:hypothetical protein
LWSFGAEFARGLDPCVDCTALKRAATFSILRYRRHHDGLRQASSRGGRRKNRRAIVNEEALNASVRKFLKTFGVTAQREIEKAVREAAAAGRLKDGSPLPAKAVVTVGAVDLKFEIESDIEVA